MAPDKRYTVLVPCDFFLPGYRAGGVLRTIANMLALLGSDFRFRVVTRGRDHAMTTPYPNIETDTWLVRSDSEILYLSETHLRPWVIRRLINETAHDTLYLNSVVSPHFGITPALLRWLNLIPRRHFIVAPNGELAESALQIKRAKKFVYLVVAKLLRLYADASWRASDEREADDIRRVFGSDARVIIAENLPTPISRETGVEREPKQTNTLKLVHLARLGRIKNLIHVLRALRKVRGDIQFDVYGPKEDPEYWAECEAIIATLPDNVIVEWKGALPTDEVIDVLGRYDLLVLPSKNESFGYVIVEALGAGCPVLISDRTPWHGLEDLGVGWDLPLDDDADFTRVIQECVDMDEQTHTRLRTAAHAYGLELSHPEAALDRYRDMIRGGGPV
jgi:glycosyltransferase involved in cell wall biosynthesis